MIKDNFGYNLWEDYFPFNVPGTTGDGLNMMWDAGAQKFGANIEMIYQLKDNMNWFLLDAVLRQPNLLINQNGDRFMNEGMMGNTTYTGNALALQPGHYGYCIMDGKILKNYKKNGTGLSSISFIRKMHSWQLTLSSTVQRKKDMTDSSAQIPSKNWLRNLALMQTNWRRLWMTIMICVMRDTILSSTKSMSICIQSQVRVATW